MEAYRIKDSQIVAQAEGLRVIDQTLAPGECVPWHLHPDTDDYIICLRGVVEIRELNPAKVTTLKAAQRYRVLKRQPHTTINTSAEDCEILIVQGPGPIDSRTVPGVAR
ncbi:cupin domain-containing protein [Ramlibacter albus]|uniref:Cupin domain-containing protein n=1 Tax=Ramlibacter albus TaxID=2079448 RepID=A0A923MBT9_9BURK|nr:cupin domain-containing protein [Ramlibacter albus]